uniref:Germin-like protein n=1 Tax=Aegilops tauschii subsp. strangulata TaxID=200361 RepID=A0A453MTM3_AEGTS
SKDQLGRQQVKCSERTRSSNQRMALHHLGLLLLAVLLPAAAIGADPDAVQDFCVPDPGRGRPVELNLIRSYPCRSPANLTAGDFAFSGVRAAGNFSADTGFAGVSVTPAQFPGLHTLGMSFARADRLFAKVLVEGEVMVFPRGMVHFQLNVGDQPATIYGTFNSENPGIVRIPATVFGSGIRDAVLERAFGLSPEELRRIEKRFGVPKKAELED